MEGFPVSSGCTNPVKIYKNDSAGEFFTAVPYPNGPNSYYLFQCLRGFVSGFGIFGLLACVIFFGSLGVRVGGCSLSNIFFGTLFGTLQVLCGLAGVISYFILLARISGSDSSQVLNVSYMFVSQPISFGVHQYWGWSAWVFIGATGWSLLMFPFTCCMSSALGDELCLVVHHCDKVQHELLVALNNHGLERGRLGICACQRQITLTYTSYSA